MGLRQGNSEKVFSINPAIVAVFIVIGRDRILALVGIRNFRDGGG
jgi:hypothetical protein